MFTRKANTSIYKKRYTLSLIKSTGYVNSCKSSYSKCLYQFRSFSRHINDEEEECDFFGIPNERELQKIRSRSSESSSSLPNSQTDRDRRPRSKSNNENINKQKLIFADSSEKNDILHEKNSSRMERRKIVRIRWLEIF